MGYHRPTTSFNIGKQGEYAERTPFLEARVGMAPALAAVADGLSA